MRDLTDHLVPGADDPTRVYALDAPDHERGGGACHVYLIREGAPPRPGKRQDGFHPAAGFHAEIRFQHGPVAEHGHNGVQMEHLLAVVIDRLRHLQAGPFACQDNEDALYHAVSALAALKRRTARRVARKVEGRNEK